MSKKIFKKFLKKRVERVKKAINKNIIDFDKHRKIAPGRPNQGRQ